MVLNVGATLSINHNWCEAGAVPNVWRYLAREAAAAGAELEAWREEIKKRRTSPEAGIVATMSCARGADDAEWRWCVERVLRASARLNVSDFVALVAREVAGRATLAPPGATDADERRTRAAIGAALSDAERRFGDFLFLDAGGLWPEAEEDASWSRAARDRAKSLLAAAIAALDRTEEKVL